MNLLQSITVVLKQLVKIEHIAKNNSVKKHVGRPQSNSRGTRRGSKFIRKPPRPRLPLTTPERSPERSPENSNIKSPIKLFEDDVESGWLPNPVLEYHYQFSDDCEKINVPSASDLNI